MKTATVSKKGWIVIPSELRKEYNLEPGAKMAFVDWNGVILLVPIPENVIKSSRGMLAGGESLTEALLEERRKDIEMEEREIRYWKKKEKVEA